MVKRRNQNIKQFFYTYCRHCYKGPETQAEYLVSITNLCSNKNTKGHSKKNKVRRQKVAQSRDSFKVHPPTPAGPEPWVQDSDKSPDHIVGLG